MLSERMLSALLTIRHGNPHGQWRDGRTVNALAARGLIKQIRRSTSGDRTYTFTPTVAGKFLLLGIRTVPKQYRAHLIAKRKPK